MTETLKNLYYSERFRKWYLIISVIIIIILIGCLIFLRSSAAGAKAANSGSPNVSSEKLSTEDLSLIMADAEASLSTVYMNIISGSRATFSDGNVMMFNEDGKFSGYFDEKNPNVTGFTYKVTSPIDKKYQASIYIFNLKDSSNVRYDVVVSKETGETKLYDSKNNNYIVLDF